MMDAYNGVCVPVLLERRNTVSMFAISLGGSLILRISKMYHIASDKTTQRMTVLG